MELQMGIILPRSGFFKNRQTIAYLTEIVCFSIIGLLKIECIHDIF